MPNTMSALIEYTSSFFKDVYNDGNNDGCLKIMCSDKEVSCHKDILLLTTNIIQSGADTFFVDNNSVKFDLRKYPYIVVNSMLNKCYSPQCKYPDNLTFDNILQIIELFEYSQYKFKYIIDLIILYISKISEQNWLEGLCVLSNYAIIESIQFDSGDIASMNKLKDISDIDFDDDLTIVELIFCIIATRLTAKINISSFGNIRPILAALNGSKMDEENKYYFNYLLMYYYQTKN